MIDLGLDIYRIIGREADRMGVDAYAVGGVVRDYFLQRPCTDIDVVCIGHSEGGEVHIGIELAQAVSAAVGGSKVSVFKTFGTASFKVTKFQSDQVPEFSVTQSLSHSATLELEFVGARRESYSHDSRKPVVENAIAVIKALIKAKPSSAKGVYIQSITLSATMTPGVKVDIREASVKETA